MKKNFLPLSRLEGVVVQDLASELLVYDLENDRAFCLNETTALVWKSCDGKKSVTDISTDLSKKLKSEVSEDVVYFALDLLKNENLLANNEQLDSKFTGMSRRDVIKKIGMGTAVAIPLVSSLTAPTPAQAQSNCLPVGSVCTSGGPQPCCSPSTCQLINPSYPTYGSSCQ